MKKKLSENELKKTACKRALRNIDHIAPGLYAAVTAFNDTMGRGYYHQPFSVNDVKENLRRMIGNLIKEDYSYTGSGSLFVRWEENEGWELSFGVELSHSEFISNED